MYEIAAQPEYITALCQIIYLGWQFLFLSLISTELKKVSGKNEDRIYVINDGCILLLTLSWQAKSGEEDMARSRLELDACRFDVEPLTIRFLRTLKELLKFVLFSYTVLLGALLLAGWTTYFMVAK